MSVCSSSGSWKGPGKVLEEPGRLNMLLLPVLVSPKLSLFPFSLDSLCFCEHTSSFPCRSPLVLSFPSLSYEHKHTLSQHFLLSVNFSSLLHLSDVVARVPSSGSHSPYFITRLFKLAISSAPFFSFCLLLWLGGGGGGGGVKTETISSQISMETVRYRHGRRLGSITALSRKKVLLCSQSSQ